MRRFRLKSDEDYKPLNRGEIYDSELVPNGWGCSVGDSAKNFPNEWEEVFEPKNHKDTDLGHFAGLAMVEFIRQYGNGYNDRIASESIAVAEELIKQLNEKGK